MTTGVIFGSHTALLVHENFHERSKEEQNRKKVKDLGEKIRYRLYLFIVFIEADINVTEILHSIPTFA